MCVENFLRILSLPIGACQDHCKQTMINKYSNKHTCTGLKIATDAVAFATYFSFLQLEKRE